MSFLSISLRRSNLACTLCRTRSYAVKAAPKPASSLKAAVADAPVSGVSSCPENTVLVGVNYLKGQDPVLALPDEEYPPWLWKLLEPKVLPDDGPGGKAEKVRLRKENRQRIRDANMLKTQ